MQNPNDRLAAEYSRVDAHAEELAERCPNPRLLTGMVAGTSEETAALFNSPYKPEWEEGIEPPPS